jgi:hypothetical protein
MPATLRGGPDGLEIVIPARRNIAVLVFLGLWLAGWAMGEKNALAQILSDGIRVADPFLLAWVLFWTVGGAVACYVWLWMLVGKERILMGASTLRMSRDILGVGWPRFYPLREIRNLRVAPPRGVPANRNAVFRLSGLGGGWIEFEYQARAIRFGASLNEAEAGMVVERMRQRFAFPDQRTVT